MTPHHNPAGLRCPQGLEILSPNNGRITRKRMENKKLALYWDFEGYLQTLVYERPCRRCPGTYFKVKVSYFKGRKKSKVAAEPRRTHNFLGFGLVAYGHEPPSNPQETHLKIPKPKPNPFCHGLALLRRNRTFQSCGATLRDQGPKQ